MATSIDNLGVQFRAIAAGKWDASKAQNNIFYSVEHVDSENNKTYDLYLGSQLLSNQDEIDAAVGRIATSEQNIQALQAIVAGLEGTTVVKYITDAIAALDSGALASRVAANEAAITKINGETIPNAIATAGTNADSKISDFKTSTVDPLATKISEAEGDIDDLEATVGNASSGLIKKVADLETTTGSHTTKIGNLEAAVNTLNGPATTTGSVRQIAADEINTLIGGVSNADTIDDIKELVEYVNTNGASLAAVVSESGENKTKIDAVIAGTTKAGNAETLDGHDSDYFAVKETVNGQLELKANAANVYTKTEVNTELGKKANSADVYTKEEANGLLEVKANSADVYTTTQTDNLLSAKANSADVYTDDEVDALLADKADKATTLEGYGITDAYKKAETYTQSEVQAQATNAANTAKDALRTELLGSSTDNDNTAPPTIYSVKNYATSVAAAALSTANTKADEKIAAALAWQPLSEM